MSRPTVAEIDLEALRVNLRQVQRLTGTKPKSSRWSSQRLWPWSAGGGQELESAGAHIFGVATTEEGIELRLGGVTSPILVLAGPIRGI